MFPLVECVYFWSDGSWFRPSLPSACLTHHRQHRQCPCQSQQGLSFSSSHLRPFCSGVCSLPLTLTLSLFVVLLSLFHLGCKNERIYLMSLILTQVFMATEGYTEVPACAWRAGTCCVLSVRPECLLCFLTGHLWLHFCFCLCLLQG